MYVIRVKNEGAFVPSTVVITGPDVGVHLGRECGAVLGGAVRSPHVVEWLSTAAFVQGSGPV